MGLSLLWLAYYRNQTDIVKLLLTYPNLNENKNKLPQDMTDIFKKYNNATKLFSFYYEILNSTKGKKTNTMKAKKQITYK